MNVSGRAECRCWGQRRGSSRPEPLLRSSGERRWHESVSGPGNCMREDPASVIAHRIGPVEFSPFGEKWVAVRCPEEFDELMRLTGGLWEAGSHRWLINRRRLNPLIHKLRRMTDPLFRRAGI